MGRNYYENVHRNEITSKKTAKGLSFLKYRKLINKEHQHHHDFLCFKNTSKEAR